MGTFESYLSVPTTSAADNKVMWGSSTRYSRSEVKDVQWCGILLCVSAKARTTDTEHYLFFLLSGCASW